MASFKNHKSNYHSHTWLCRHAKGDVIDYLKEAIKHGFHTLGVSDHAPYKVLYERGSLRMSEDEFYNKYLQMFDNANSLAKEHNIKIYKGLEIEYIPNNNDYYLKLLKGLDYLILGQHYIIINGKFKSSFGLSTIEEVKIYSDMVVEALKTNHFKMLAHPELCFYNILNPTKEMFELLRPVIKTCKELNIPLEINANGIRKVGKKQSNNYHLYPYPVPYFWQMVKEEGASAIITSDAHLPEELNDWAVEKAYEFANHFKIKLINDLDI